MKAIVTVIGKDNTGIISKVSTYLSEVGGNIEDISQTLMQGYFVMIMLVDFNKAEVHFAQIEKHFEEMGKELNLSIRLQREEIFNAMHRI